MLDFHNLALEHALKMWANVTGLAFITIPAESGEAPDAMHPAKPRFPPG